MNPLISVEGPRLVAVVGLISVHVQLARAAWNNHSVPAERAFRTKQELIQARASAKRLVEMFDKAIKEVNKETGRTKQPVLPGLSQNAPSEPEDWRTMAEGPTDPEPRLRERERPG